MTGSAAAAKLFLFDRPRVEVRLPQPAAAALPAWVVVELPGPQAKDRPEGRFVADPRLPEVELTLSWGAVPGGTRAVLTVSLGERTWVLEQDARYPSRWRLRSDPDHRRHWS
jgi:hypothetical protein